MPNNDYDPSICPSRPRIDWQRTEKLVPWPLNRYKASVTYLYRCTLCKAEFSWVDGQNHKVPFETLSLFPGKSIV